MYRDALKVGPVLLSNSQPRPGRNLSQPRAHLLVKLCLNMFLNWCHYQHILQTFYYYWTFLSQVRFIHTTTGQALKFSMKTYPDWGFHQHEVCADKLVDQVDTVWNVEEHR